MKKGWEIKKLGEVCEFQNGFAFKSNLFTDSGLPILRISNIQDFGIDTNNLVYFNDSSYKENFERFKVYPNDILIAMSGGTTGKLGINNTDTIYYLNQRVGKFSPSNKLNRTFLYYFLQTKSEESLAIAGGAAQPNLSTEQIKNFEIPFPPLPEQQRIVQLLDEAFEKIDTLKANAERNLKNAKELFQNSLQVVFENKGKAWEEIKLGELATFRNGMNFTRGSKGEEIQIVGVKDFQNSFWVPFESLETVTIDGKLNEIDFLKEDDILAVRSNGNPNLIGRTLLAGHVNGRISHSGFTIRIRLNSKIVSPIYLCNYLKTQKTRKELVESGIGIGIKSLNQGSLSSLTIPFPKSLTEQQTIVEHLDALSARCKALEINYQKTIAQCNEMKKAVLAKAFNGEL